MTAAYVFTNYHVQGQTIPTVIVDLMRVPTGKLTMTAMNVALSRNVVLMDEDDRLEMLNENTKA
ncbi:hypothetical protein BT96DRAFT_824384 [Gymnopus androsaceus JB14]|uniref:Uncharacterized protein n=1 Tax=Gymnopus androsaceus JB14 TaxID=1447944 RepID=A0A6A4HG21_9AGAR|nr:hypothetical protein BT96DRAFT_824384 [Gymnopus androsaceus JB14]